jgi:hypothetical protein
MAASETASLPAVALRHAPVELLGSPPPPTLDQVAAAYAELLHQLAAGTIGLEIETRFTRSREAQLCGPVYSRPRRRGGRGGVCGTSPLPRAPIPSRTVFAQPRRPKSKPGNGDAACGNDAA